MTVPAQSPYPEPSQATTILILAIVGLVLSLFGVLCCGLLSPLGSVFGGVAWYLGRKEMTAIQNGLRNPSQQSTAKAGMIMGIVATVLGILLFVLFLVFFGVAFTEGVVRS
jgi:hypothetical protein